MQRAEELSREIINKATRESKRVIDEAKKKSRKEGGRIIEEAEKEALAIISQTGKEEEKKKKELMFRLEAEIKKALLENKRRFMESVIDEIMSELSKLGEEGKRKVYTHFYEVAQQELGEIEKIIVPKQDRELCARIMEGENIEVGEQEFGIIFISKGGKEIVDFTLKNIKDDIVKRVMERLGDKI